MQAAPLRDNEERCIAALHDLHVLDSAGEALFDALTRAAALACGVPIALITLVDSDRQWFKSCHGLEDVTETPRNISLCAHAVLTEGVLEVPDTLLDLRFAANPAVTGYPFIRFYAGAPLVLDGGERIGTLCLVDRVPRVLTPAQREILAQLARSVAQALQTRAAALNRNEAVSQLSDAMDELDQVHRLLLERNLALLDAQRLSHTGSWEWVVADDRTVWSDELYRIFGRAPGSTPPNRGACRRLYTPSSFARLERAINQALETGTAYRLELQFVRPDGTRGWIDTRGEAIWDGGRHRVVKLRGTIQEISARKESELELERNRSALERTGQLARIGSWELDAQTRRLHCSEELLRVHGVAFREHPSAAEWIAAFAEASRPVLRIALERAVAQGMSFDLELEIEHGDGGRRWVRAVGSPESEAGSVSRVAGVLQDITDLVRQREALGTTRRRLGLTSETGRMGVWERDLETGVLVWDEASYRLHGALTGDQTPVELVASRVHPEDRAGLAEVLHQALQTGRMIDFEFRVVWPNLSVRTLRSVGRVVRDASGRPVRMIGVNWDVTELRSLNRELTEHQEWMQVTLRAIGDGVLTVDTEGRVLWLNPVGERLTGWLARDAVGRPCRQVFHLIDGQTRQPIEVGLPGAAGQASLPQAAPMVHPVLVSRDDREYGIEAAVATIHGDRGEVLGSALVFKDVTEQRRLSGEIHWHAAHDALTGLFNRREFESRLAAVVAACRHGDGEHALLRVDLDQFKLVNDACGHAAGDQLLVQVARILAEIVRDGDTLARLGGDEFAVIVHDCTTEQALGVANAICQRMEDFRFVHGDRGFRIGTSIGLVTIDQRWSDADAALQAAEGACDTAKEAGRNRVHPWFASDALIGDKHGDMQWATRLEHAIEEDRFVLFGQRICPVGSGAAPGAGPLHLEVLVRLIERDGSMVLPADFLPAAERFHLSARIDRWVLRQALALLGAQQDLSALASISVNLSAQSIGDQVFRSQAIDLLSRSGPPICGRVVLEITETAALTNLGDAAAFIDEVRRLGVRVALDDFGTGAASFGYLKSLPIDLLKIDGQFVRDLLDDPLDDAAVRSFHDVARVVGVKTVAGFVETQPVLTRLAEIGVDYVQGYLLHRPEPIENLLRTPALESIRS